jgi:hypothetical protein
MAREGLHEVEQQTPREPSSAMADTVSHAGRLRDWRSADDQTRSEALESLTRHRRMLHTGVHERRAHPRIGSKFGARISKPGWFRPVEGVAENISQ